MLSLAQRFSRVHRIALLFGLLAGPSTVFTKSQIASNPSQPFQLRSTDIIHRPTSQPYTGDLSIFEDPQRDKKLQVNRVMDLLGIHTGSVVADIGAGSGWFSARAARPGGKHWSGLCCRHQSFLSPLHFRSGPEGEAGFRPSLTATEQARARV